MQYKNTWNLANNILQSNRKREVYELKSVVFNNQTYNSNSEIAKAITIFRNYHFSSVGNNIDASIQSDNRSLNTSILNSSMSNSFFFKPTTSFQVNKIISSFKNKSSNINTFSTKIIKSISAIISPILSRLINISISSGHFPASFKIARVVPVFKSGDKKDVNNYRPISILPIFSKIFEKVVCHQLYTYFESFKLFSSSQFGFRKKVSTSNAITNTLQYIYDHLDQGDTVVSIFLDFSKAFDCVNHNILLEKMSAYGVRGVASRWFKSYLSGRLQYVSFNNATSELCSIDRGVPRVQYLDRFYF